MNRSPISQVPSLSIRFRYLCLSLSIFYLLYNLTTLYSLSLYALSPFKVHNLAIPLDDVIPFIPFMIAPYSWSLILFVISFFLVRTSTQLSVLTQRLVLATVFGCFIFYCYPARFSFYRLLPNDWTQLGYQLLQLVDKPFNQLPSLHVSYAILIGMSLWDAATSKRYWVLRIYRIAIISVCTLVAISTVLTYQHHLLDVLGGVALAIIVWALSYQIRNSLVTKQLVLGVIGFLFIAIAGFYIANIEKIASGMLEIFAKMLALYWLASFMLLAWLYQQDSAAHESQWFKKSSHGHLTVTTWIKFAPIIIIYSSMSFLGRWYFNVFLKSRRNTIKPYFIDEQVGVVASPRLTQADIPRHLNHWFCSVLSSHQTLPRMPSDFDVQMVIVDLAAEVSSHINQIKIATKAIGDTKTLSAYPVYYLYLPLLDLQPLNEVSVEAYVDLFEKLDDLTQPIKVQLMKESNGSQIDSNVITIINFHCVMGLSRSVSVQVLYLLYRGTLSACNYRHWHEQYYPYAHLSESYLSLSLVTTIVNAGQYKYKKMDKSDVVR